MFDSIDHTILKLFLNHIFGVNNLGFCHIGQTPKASFKNVYCLSILMHGVISLPDAASCDKL